MMKLAIALIASAALTGSAVAADLPARTYTKAPVVQAAPSWTGFYIFGGAGGGIWDAPTGVVDTATGVCILCASNKQAGDGWYGTVGAGYDWQFNQSWVLGILADGQFGSLKGSISDGLLGLNGVVSNNLKLQDTWAVGARIGYLVAPSVLSYVNGGYTGSNWSGSTLLDAATVTPSGFHTNGFTTQGWFVGGGVENNLDIFGISAPGLFMKTEYRAAYYENNNLTVLNDVTNTSTGTAVNFRPLVQTISTSLVYRFNWSGPLVAKY